MKSVVVPVTKMEAATRLLAPAALALAAAATSAAAGRAAAISLALNASGRQMTVALIRQPMGCAGSGS
jgi:hypothetical protein